MVVKDEAEIFTILFPIKIALSIFSFLSMTFKRTAAELFPSSIKVTTRNRLMVIRAVSADEKNAESPSKIIMMMNLNSISGSKLSLPFFYIYNDFN